MERQVFAVRAGRWWTSKPETAILRPVLFPDLWVSMMFRPIAVCLVALTLASCGGKKAVPEVSRQALPITAWDHRPEASNWTRATLRAIEKHGAVLPQTVPQDVAEFCPGYRQAGAAERSAFWVGMLSALAKHESTWRPEASGGGGRWIGLLQIAPGTARAFGCEAQSASALKNGAANLSCAVRIAAAQVARDGLLVSDGDNWRGLGRDWAPFRDPDKRAQMAGWTRSQPYCAAN